MQPVVKEKQLRIKLCIVKFDGFWGNVEYSQHSNDDNHFYSSDSILIVGEKTEEVFVVSEYRRYYHK